MQAITIILGIIATICFASSGLPQAIKSFRDGHSNGIANWSILLCVLRGISILLYIISLNKIDYLLLINYICNLGTILIVAKYKIWPRTSG